MPALPIPARFGHVNLIARGWRALAEFYERVFGCAPVPPERNYSGPKIEAATALPGARIRGVHLLMPGHEAGGPTLEIYTYDALASPVRPEVNRPGFGHIAFQVDDVAGDVFARAAAAGHGGLNITGAARLFE